MSENEDLVGNPMNVPSGSARSLTYRSAVNDRLALMHAITQNLGVLIGDTDYASHCGSLADIFNQLLQETRYLLKEDLPK